MLECWGEEWKVSKTKLEDQAPVGCKEDTPMKETFQGSDHHESLVIEATSQRRSSQGEPRDNHNPKRRLNPLLGCRTQGGELGRSPLLLLSSTRMISLSRCGGVRSMAEWMERSSTESASLTKMNTMLTSGRLSGNERLRHLERRTARLSDLSVSRLGSPKMLARPISWF